MSTRIHIAGVPIDSVSYSETLREIARWVDEGRKGYVVTANPEMVLLANRDEKFMDVLQAAQLSTPDGVGILWAAHYLARPLRNSKLANWFQLYGSLACILMAPKRIRDVIKERITGTDLLKHVVQHAGQKQWRIFLLGASNGVAKQVIKRFSKDHPDVQFVGSYAGSPSLDEEDEICKLINQANPDLLFVAYGNPHQEYWIRRNLFKLDSVNAAVGVGGAFDFYSGRVKRAPKWMQKFGLEWVWRLSREPKRIKRIWNATGVFVRLIVDEKRRS